MRLPEHLDRFVRPRLSTVVRSIVGRGFRLCNSVRAQRILRPDYQPNGGSDECCAGRCTSHQARRGRKLHRRGLSGGGSRWAGALADAGYGRLVHAGRAHRVALDSVGQTLHCLSRVGRICVGKGAPTGDLSRRHSDDPAQYDAHGRRPRPPVQPSGDVGKWRAGPGHNLGRARQRQQIQDGTRYRQMQAAQPSAPAARSAAISAGSSQPARVASASSPRFGGWGGIGMSGTVRLNRGAGAGCAIPSIST
jgi:hypothetical protein